MMTCRELHFFVARVAGQADRPADVLTALKAIIAIDAALNDDERNLLSVAYKALTTPVRTGLRNVSTWLEADIVATIPGRVAGLTAFKTKLVAELDGYCKDLILLIDSKLLPAARDIRAVLFYEKLKADYYRYSIEFKSDPERFEGVVQAQAGYERAAAIARAELTRLDPASLTIALNYSVFLYEILGKKQEAIDLADRAYKEGGCCIDGMDEATYSELTLIFELLKGNIALWTEEQAEARAALNAESAMESASSVERQAQSVGLELSK
jgi:14-3-3 protein epsilon